MTRATTASDARLDSLILETCEASAIPREWVKRLGFKLVDPAELTALGRKPIKTMVLPYFDVDGAALEFHRFRYLEDPRTSWERKVLQTKPLRYFQPPGTGLKAYFPPVLDWRELADDPRHPLLITEGEKKAASASIHGFACVGLGGVDCFASKQIDSLLLPELMEFKWENRDVVIVYDSDAYTNPNVLAASVRLGRRLFSLGASVRITSLPAAKDGSKQGVDDYIRAAEKNGENIKTAMLQLIETASADLFEREIALHEFNQKFVYLRDMDRVIVREDGIILNPEAFVRRAYAACTHREWSVKVDKKSGDVSRVPTLIPTADAWMLWEQRLTRKTLDFDPLAGELTDHNYNLWRGWPVSPAPGPVDQWHALLDRLFLNAPAVDRQWFERWCAWPIQHPGAKLKTAVIIWSHAEGTGKSTILETLRAVYGGLAILMNDKSVDLKYTDWLVNKLFVGVDDISGKTREEHSAHWRNLITSPMVAVEKKYVPTFSIANRVNFLFTSNEPNALRISSKDRRYYVHEAAEWGDRPEREAFFDDYYRWLNTEGAAALMHYFLNLDTKGFNPDASALTTASKLDMVEAGKGPLEKWLEDLLDAPDAVLRIGSAQLPGDLWTSDDLVALYNDRPGNKSPVTRVTMGMALTAAGVRVAYKGNAVRLKTGLKQRLYIVRNAEHWVHAPGPECRDHYTTTRTK
jgi:hypothetical protein